MKRDKVKAIIKLAYILGRAHGMSKNAAGIMDNITGGWRAMADAARANKRTLAGHTAKELLDTLKWFTSPEFFKYLRSRGAEKDIIKKDLAPDELIRAFITILKGRGGNEALLNRENLEDFVKSIAVPGGRISGEVAKHLPSGASPRLLYKLLRQNVEALRNAVEANEATSHLSKELRDPAKLEEYAKNKLRGLVEQGAPSRQLKLLRKYFVDSLEGLREAESAREKALNTPADIINKLRGIAR